MRPEDDILFFRHDDHRPIEDFLYHLDRKDLKVGRVIGNKVRGKTTKRYLIKHIDDGFITKVSLKPVFITFADILQLIVIALLGYFVFDYLWPLIGPSMPE